MILPDHTTRRAVRFDDATWDALGSSEGGRSRVLRTLAQLYLSDEELRFRVQNAQLDPVTARDPSRKRVPAPAAS